MKSTLLLLLLSCTLTLVSNGQALKKADQAYDLMQYAKAIQFYKEALKKDPDNQVAARKLANSYKNIRQYDQMLYTYESIVSKPNVENQDYYNLARAYLMFEKQTDAKKYAQIYKSKAPGLKADFLETSINKRTDWLSHWDDYIQDMSTGNSITRYSVFSPLLYEQDLLVTIESPKKSSDQWSGRNFTAVYKMTNSLKLQDPLVKLKGWSDRHESQEAIDPKSDDYYFTTNHEKAKGAGDYDIHNLKICYIDLNDNTQSIQEFAYNDISYNVCHPAISPDGQIMVFASDMPGGKGGLDLYYCTRAGDSWAKPVNISALNSYGNEKFPSFVDGGKLAYSSDALPGLGGLDIYIADHNGSQFSTPQNPGYPVNSAFNDFGLATTNHIASGYVSTDRNTKDGRIEVIHYTQKVIETIKETAGPDQKKLNVLVVDKYTEIPLPDVTITLKAQGQTYKTLTTDASGKASVMLPTGTLLDISGQKNGVSTTTADVGNLDYQSSDAVIFKKLTHNDPRFTLLGEVHERKTNNPVAGVRVELDNESQGTQKSTNSDTEGKFSFQLEQSSDFTVKGVKEGIYSNSKTITTKGLDRSTTLYAKLLLNVDIICLGNNLVIEDIYYDYNKWNIREDARRPLNQLVELLRTYPDMKIELSSHTDKRGSDKYNIELSQKRAESCRKYLLSKGVSGSRIIAKGYGESKLAVVCDPCTEEQHQANRRTEIEILECQTCPKCD